MIATQYPNSCIAMHTTNPEVPGPSLRCHTLTWFKYHIARLTRGQISFLAFGCTSDDFTTTKTADSKDSRSLRTMDMKVLSYTLADSPTGLLAFLLDLIRPKINPPKADDICPYPNPLPNPWTYPDILTWTMLYWLPGPESPLRWLRNASCETSALSGFWRPYSYVPLGISYFRPGGDAKATPPLWASAYHNLVWLTRHEQDARWPAWETPDQITMDIRSFVGSLRDGGHLDIGSFNGDGVAAAESLS